MTPTNDRKRMIANPWGTGPAPTHNCHHCGRRIGKSCTHFLIPATRPARFVLCPRCAVIDGRINHAKYYPECPWEWHDLQDHGVHFATRAAAWSLLNDTTSTMEGTHK
ncbi:hypothetical protein VT930_11965 [Mycobacterium sherrisii]|uniref:hypothetical protein n=1 Tax=Mycobacterium sherrisii TaxID=243061 RepID=UPI002DDD6217|nr:hypothetical protein [Mycobacterium sherrisii]MEC4763820.1 hypothetical protein [Mycobacterium sherrisii]